MLKLEIIIDDADYLSTLNLLSIYTHNKLKIGIAYLNACSKLKNKSKYEQDKAVADIINTHSNKLLQTFNKELKNRGARVNITEISAERI